MLCSVSALSVSAPSTVQVTDTNSFIVEITNNSNIEKELTINFFSTANVKIHSPKAILPHSKISVKINLDYSSPNYTEMESKLEVYLDNEFKEKMITQKFYPTGTNKNTNINSNDQSGEYAGALFGLAAMGEFASFSVLEWALFIVLVIVAAILLLTLIARAIKVRK
jgi:hypothetical protein